MTTVTIRQLTPSNVQALFALADARGDVHVSATTATFDMTPAEAVTMVENYQSGLGAKHGTTGHPYKSLHAVIRKLYRQVEPYKASDEK